MQEWAKTPYGRRAFQVEKISIQRSCGRNESGRLQALQSQDGQDRARVYAMVRKKVAEVGRGQVTGSGDRVRRLQCIQSMMRGVEAEIPVRLQKSFRWQKVVAGTRMGAVGVIRFWKHFKIGTRGRQWNKITRAGNEVPSRIQSQPTLYYTSMVST